MAAEQKAEAVALVPLGRIGTPDDLGKAAVFLASDDSAYITGIECLAVRTPLHRGWLSSLNPTRRRGDRRPHEPDPHCIRRAADAVSQSDTTCRGHCDRRYHL